MDEKIVKDSQGLAKDLVNDCISRYGVSAWLANRGYRGLANKVMDEDRFPSAQPEIIRCRECRHYTFADNRAFGFPAKRCEWTGFEDVDDDDFCSRAERREVSE